MRDPVVMFGVAVAVVVGVVIGGALAWLAVCAFDALMDSIHRWLWPRRWRRIQLEQAKEHEQWVQVHRRTPAQLRGELRQFEDRYGVPSARMVEAFTVNGGLRETSDFARWSLIYTAYQRVCL